MYRVWLVDIVRLGRVGLGMLGRFQEFRVGGIAMF